MNYLFCNGLHWLPRFQAIVSFALKHRRTERRGAGGSCPQSKWSRANYKRKLGKNWQKTLKRRHTHYSSWNYKNYVKVTRYFNGLGKKFPSTSPLADNNFGKFTRRKIFSKSSTMGKSGVNFLPPPNFFPPVGPCWLKQIREVVCRAIFLSVIKFVLIL